MYPQKSESLVRYWIRVVPPAVISSAYNFDYMRSRSQTGRVLLNGAADEIEHKYRDIIVTDLSVPNFSLEAMSKEKDFENLFKVKVQGENFSEEPKIPKNLESVIAGIKLISRVVLYNRID